MITLRPAAPPDPSQWMNTGDETMPRVQMTVLSQVAPTSGQMRLTFWTARRSFTSTAVLTYTGGTAAAATPTLCRMGLYSIAANNDGTLIAATANDTTLWAAITTGYTRSWTTPVAITAGARYGFAPLIVSGAAVPNFPGSAIAIATEATTRLPYTSGAVNALADLPASFTGASLSLSGQRMYAVLT